MIVHRRNGRFEGWYLLGIIPLWIVVHEHGSSARQAFSRNTNSYF